MKNYVENLQKIIQISVCGGDVIIPVKIMLLNSNIREENNEGTAALAPTSKP